MRTADSVIQQIRESSNSNKEIGDKFEKFALKFLQTDPVWKNQFAKIFYYSEWARQNNRRANDIGIDLVGELADGSGSVAIQCKCYNADHRIEKGDLDKFISAATVDPFTMMIFIDTTEGDWGINAENAILGRTEFKRIRLDDFRKSKINWDDFAEKFETKVIVELIEPKKIREYQKIAIQNVLTGFENHDRGKMIMACGTGKTFTSLKIAETLADKGIGGGGVSLFLFPPSL